MIGQEVGSYKITDKIGEGGMGSVFKGIDVMLEREVAVKMLRPELSSQADVVERFRTEAVTLAKLNHPNIATLFSFLRQGEDFFMVMEFVRGETLDEVLRKRGAMNSEQAINLFCHALEGIDHAHRLGVIHRDIKPANIMLTDDGMLKVMDFGIARMLGTSRMTKHGNIIGTIEYMSPEQVRGDETDARSDIYSLGILLYEMLTGRVPFSSKSEFELMRSQIEEAPPPPRTFADTIPLPIEQAIMRALAKKPQARFQTANEFRAHLINTIGKGGTGEAGSAVYAAPATRMMEPLKIPTDSEGSPYATKAFDSRSSETLLDKPHDLSPPEETQAESESATAILETGKQTGETPTEATVELSPTAAQRAASLSLPESVDEQKATQPNETLQTEESSKQQASLISKLNRMHYTAAAIVLLLLIGVPLALMSGGGEQTPAEVPAAEQPVDNLAPAADPAASSETSADKPAADGSKDSTDPKDAKAAGSPDAAQPSTDDAKSKEDKTAAAKEGEKKEEGKASKVGGFLKKLNPFKGGEKKDEKKDEKKKEVKKP